MTNVTLEMIAELRDQKSLSEYPRYFVKPPIFFALLDLAEAKLREEAQQPEPEQADTVARLRSKGTIFGGSVVLPPNQPEGEAPVLMSLEMIKTAATQLWQVRGPDAIGKYIDPLCDTARAYWPAQERIDTLTAEKAELKEKLDLDMDQMRFMKERITSLQTSLSAAIELLQALEPHLDSIVCYASTPDEYKPNAIVRDIRNFLKTHAPEPGDVPEEPEP